MRLGAHKGSTTRAVLKALNPGALAPLGCVEHLDLGGLVTGENVAGYRGRKAVTYSST